MVLSKAVFDFVERKFNLFALLFLFADVLINAIIIYKVPYTEIDWIAYMQEVGGFLNGEWNYNYLRGDTGPCVYPAGFIYIFSILSFITDNGKNILFAQVIFAAIYLSQIIVLIAIYKRLIISTTAASSGIKRAVPTLFMLIILIGSRRIHSIFVLRLFNDGVTMLFIYMFVLSVLEDKWVLGLTLYSIALSIKMNAFLFLPGLLILLVKRFGFVRMMLCVFYLVMMQALIGSPFLLTDYKAYMNGAFNFGRKFFYIWSVNLKFLPYHLFTSDTLSRALLAAHFGSLILFGLKWTTAEWKQQSIGAFLKMLWRGSAKQMTKEHMVHVLFISNFVGIVFSRSLHYQFYSWYYHTLPFILWALPSFVPTIAKFAVVIAIEISWNIYPSTFYSSLLLTACHLIIYLLLAFTPVRYPYVEGKSVNSK